MTNEEDNGDFTGYMETLAEVEKIKREQDAMLQAHEEWRYGTWGGYIVRTIQDITNHFRPFLSSVLQSMEDEEKSITKIILFSIVRLVIIFIVVGSIYTIGKIIQNIMGREIVVEEEIIILHEYSTQEEADKAAAKAKAAIAADQEGEGEEDGEYESLPLSTKNTKQSKKTTRGKKQKNS